MALLVLLNNFLHDFSAAGWIFCTIILWRMLAKQQSGKPMVPQAAEAVKTILFLMRASMAGIVVFGVIRALAYKTHEWSEAAGSGQITLLVIKHVLLAATVVAGIMVYRKGKISIRDGHNETQ